MVLNSLWGKVVYHLELCSFVIFVSTMVDISQYSCDKRNRKLFPMVAVTIVHLQKSWLLSSTCKLCKLQLHISAYMWSGSMWVLNLTTCTLSHQLATTLGHSVQNLLTGFWSTLPREISEHWSAPCPEDKVTVRPWVGNIELERREKGMLCVRNSKTRWWWSSHSCWSTVTHFELNVWLWLWLSSSSSSLHLSKAMPPNGHTDSKPPLSKDEGMCTFKLLWLWFQVDQSETFSCWICRFRRVCESTDLCCYTPRTDWLASRTVDWEEIDIGRCPSVRKAHQVLEQDQESWGSFANGS